MQITAKRTNGAEVSVEYEFGDNLKALTDKFGEPIVFNHAKGSMVVAIQGWLRAQLDAGKSADEIKTAAREWKPGQRKQGKTQAEKLKEQLGKMSPEDRQALLKELKASTKPTAVAS